MGWAAIRGNAHVPGSVPGILCVPWIQRFGKESVELGGARLHAHKAGGLPFAVHDWLL